MTSRLPAAFLTGAMSLAAAEPKADVVVYGGTPCGIAAAVMAARAGAEVTLIEPTRHIGGLATSGLNTAETEHMLEWTIGGFSREFYECLGRHYRGEPPDSDQPARPAYDFESGVAEQVSLALLKEAGVTVRYGAGLRSVVKEGTALRSITLTDNAAVSAKVFIDAGYEGDLMAAAGVEYAVGREGRDEFGEEAAGIRFNRETIRVPTVDARGNLLPGISGWKKDYKEGDAHRGVMNYNFRLTATRDPAARVPFPKPKNHDPARFQLLAHWLKSQEGTDVMARHGRLIDLYPRRNGKMEMNNRQAAIFSLGHFGGQFDWPEADEKRRREIFDDHLEYTLGLLHFLATDDVVPENMREDMRSLGLHSGEFADNGHLPYQLYVREGRRMRGGYVVRQQDVQTDRRKPDSIGISSHFIDCHHVQRLAVSENGFVNEGRIWRRGHAYQIPYLSLTPKPADCANLLVPGAASFTHVAYCTLRLESVWMITGHSAGVAAAMAAKADSTVQDVPVADLQEKLRGQRQVIDFIPGKPEACDPPRQPPEF